MKPYILVLIVLSSLFFSCEQVVDIDLNEVAPAIVIEGRVLKDSLAWVQVRQTTSYFHPDTQQCICNAVVTIREDENTPDTLVHELRGTYRSTALRGKERSTYHLRVTYGNEIYEAEAYLNETPRIYSLTQRSFGSFGSFGDSSGLDFGGGVFPDTIPYFLFVDLYEDQDTENFYMFEYCANGELISGIYNVGSDENARGDTLSYSPGPRALFYPGDTVSVRVHAIDEGVYTYFDQLNDALNSNSFFSSTPYNPLSNISNGALGYFAAMSADCDTTVITYEVPVFPRP